MKTKTITRLVGVTCAAALASCASPPESTRMPVSASFQPQNSTSSQLFQEVNAYRRSKGADDLQRHHGLDRLAQEHCEYLRKHRGSFSLSGRNVSHIGFEGRALVARSHYQMENVSENVAAANHPGASATTTLIGLWKGSKDHHKNMCDDWTHTGIGVVKDSDGMVFATQLFSTVSYSQLSTRERFNRF
jgi:uncharacterized protein YkwD